MKACVRPLAMEGLVGVMAMETRAGAVTVSTAVLLVTLPEVAVMLEVPACKPVATPAAVMEATVPSLECQVAEFVRSCVLLSVYVPVAVKACVRPLAMEGLVGAIAMETRVGAVTVNTAVLLVMAPEVAVIFELPAARPVATPAALIEATVPLLEFQAAEFVRSAVLLSVYVPVAVKACVKPLAIDGLAGVTAIETRAGAVTVSWVVLLMLVLGSVAVIVTGPPAATPDATPVFRPMVAIVMSEDVQFTEVVRFCVLLSV